MGGLLTGVGLTACEHTDVTADWPTDPGMEETDGGNHRLVRFAGRIDGDLEPVGQSGTSAALTRSALQDGRFAAWNEGDAVTVSDGILSCVYEVTETDGTTCMFRVGQGGNPFTQEATAEATPFYAFYPEKAVTDAGGRGGWFGSQVNAMLFAEQNYAENADGGSFGLYMAAEGAPLQDGQVSFTFRPVSSVIEVDLTALGDGIVPATVSVKSNSGVSLTGLLKYDCASRTATVSTTDKTDCSAHTQSDVVTVSGLPEGVGTVRLYVLPVQLQGGVTLTVQDTEGRFYTKVDTATVGTAATEGLTAIGGVTGAQACTPYYKKYDFGAAADAPRLNNWMATIPGNVRFCMLSVPAAHDAATSGVTGFWASSARTQSLDIAAMLAGGVRGFDLRPRYNSGTQSDIELDNLEIYHGPVATGVKFKDAMQLLADFVKNNPTECVYVRIKKENSKMLFEPTDQSVTWRASIRTCLKSHLDGLVRTVSSTLLLSACRGKLIVTTDNPYGEEGSLEGTVYGGRLSWTDNTKGMNTVINYVGGAKACDAYVQDFYSGEVTEKTQLVAASLAKASADATNRWYFSFLNLSGSPASAAQTVNAEALPVVEGLKGRTGLVFYDFCLDDEYGGGALNKAIVARNFGYVYADRTRRAAAGDLR